MTRWLCGIGWHNWAYGLFWWANRVCHDCGKKQRAYPGRLGTNWRVTP